MLQNIKHKLVRSSRTKKKNGGFTLIEVIAVTVILGVLATMLIPSIDGAGAKARDAKLKNDLMTADQAVALYKLDKGTLPTNLKALFPVYLKNSDLKDAKNNDLVFHDNKDGTYFIQGQNSAGKEIKSNEIQSGTTNESGKTPPQDGEQTPGNP